MNDELRMMKRAVALSVLAFSLQPLAFSAINNGVYADTNYAILPGYTLQATQIVGTLTTQLPTNLATWPALLDATNRINTNLVARIVATSNQFVTVFGTLWGSGTNGVGHPGNPLGTMNNLAIGGTNNAWPTWPMYSSVIIGGRDNMMSGQNVTPANEGSAILGGIFNRIWWPNLGCAVLVGSTNYIAGGSRSVIVGGNNAWLYGDDSVILGGARNHLQYNDSVILGGRSNYVVSSGSVAAGYGAYTYHNNTFVWSDANGIATNFLTTAANQFLVSAAGGVGVNTNDPGTNALRVRGTIDVTGPGAGFTLNGTNLVTLFNITNLSILFNFLLTSNVTLLAAADVTTSNVLFNFTSAVSNSVTTSSNVLRTAINTTSNALQTQIYTAQYKAFTATLPATYASIGIGFSAPLMADGNYSVNLTPQDQTTADAALQGQTPWVGSKTASGFTLAVPYATNTYNLNYECSVKANTQ